MSATPFNLSIEQDVDFSFTITVLQQTGSPLNISSGYTFFSKIRPDYKSAPLLSLSLGSGIAITNGSGGIITVSFTNAQTLALPPTTTYTTLVYDVLMVQASGNVKTLLVGGTISVAPVSTNV